MRRGMLLLAMVLLSGNVLSADPPAAQVATDRRAREVREAWGDTIEGARVCVRAVDDKVLAAHPVMIEVILKNLSEKPIRIVETTPEGDFRLSVLDAKGLRVPLTRYGAMRLDSLGEITRRVVTTLAPGKEIAFRFALNRWFDLTLAGKYTVSASRPIVRNRTAGAAAGSPFTTVNSGTMDITVVDRS